MEFTFHGELLGISSAYKLGAKTVYDKHARDALGGFRPWMSLGYVGRF